MNFASSYMLWQKTQGVQTSLEEAPEAAPGAHRPIKNLQIAQLPGRDGPELQNASAELGQCWGIWDPARHGLFSLGASEQGDEGVHTSGSTACSPPPPGKKLAKSTTTCSESRFPQQTGDFLCLGSLCTWKCPLPAAMVPASSQRVFSKLSVESLLLWQGNGHCVHSPCPSAQRNEVFESPSSHSSH